MHIYAQRHICKENLEIVLLLSVLHVISASSIQKEQFESQVWFVYGPPHSEILIGLFCVMLHGI